LPTFGRPTMPQRKPMVSPSGERHREERSDAAIRLDCFAALAMTENRLPFRRRWPEGSTAASAAVAHD